MNDNSDFWAKALWKKFSSQMVSHEPFYFAADSELIKEIFNDHFKREANVSEALSSFHQACRSLLNVRGSKLQVLQTAYDTIPGCSFSRVICLAIQQVLVVELMLNDEKYSENSYFPRYRECLGLSSNFAQVNPLSSSEFRQIWDLLAVELTQDKESSPIVTFFPGSGRDLNRKLPFSQALFTTHDLSLVKKKVPQINAETNDEEIIYNLFKIRNSFGKRAQVLLARSDAVFFKNLCKQIRTFLISSDRVSMLKPKIRFDSGAETVLIAFLDDDFFEDSFSFYLRTDVDQVSGKEVEDHLARRLMTRDFVILVSKDYSYEESLDGEGLSPGDSILLIGKANRVQSLVNGLSSLKTCGLRIIQNNLHHSFSAFFIDSISKEGLNELFGDIKVAAEEKLSLRGGLKAEVKSKIYMPGYPPTSIYYCGQELSPSESIDLNGKPTTVREFLSSLALVNTQHLYFVKYGDGHVEFAISPQSSERMGAMLLGYSLDVYELGLSPIEVKPDSACLRGNLLTEAVVKKVNVKYELQKLDLLNLVSRGTRMPLKQEELETLLARLRASDIDSPLKNLALNQIEFCKSVPAKSVASGLLRKILAVEV